MVWFIAPLIIGGITVIATAVIITISKLKSFFKKSAPKTIYAKVRSIIKRHRKNGGYNEIPEGTLEAICFGENGKRLGKYSISGKFSQDVANLKKGDYLYV